MSLLSVPEGHHMICRAGAGWESWTEVRNRQEGQLGPGYSSPGIPTNCNGSRWKFTQKSGMISLGSRKLGLLPKVEPRNP
jgi:hypothetical protein